MQNRELFEWEKHENHVAAVYELLGFKVTTNINIDGQQTDLVCEKWTPGAGKIVLFVECKYTEKDDQNTVSKDMVTQFIANFHALKRSNGWTMGVMVSNKRFSQYAKSAAVSHSDIVLKTIDDLYADLFQIHSYLYSSITQYEYETDFANYIPLKAIDKSNSWGARSEPTALADIFYRWLEASNSRQLSLLGDFGTGKTTFMRHIHMECAKKFLDGKFTRMPLYIQLRDYYNIANREELIEKFFSNELTTKVPYKIFNEFNQSGRFLLLLDGFDEMGTSTDSLTRKRNFLKISQLISEQSKVVITCRPAYFPSYDELVNVFGIFRRQIEGTTEMPGYKYPKNLQKLSNSLVEAAQDTRIKELLNAVGLNPRMNHIAALQLFDEEQIKSYLLIHDKDIVRDSGNQLNHSSLYLLMGKIYDLEDLAKRPILLKLIVKTLPLFRKGKDGKYYVGDDLRPFQDITPSILYHVYTEGELTREYNKGEIRWQIDREQRRKLIGRIAYEMFQADTIILDTNDLPGIIDLYFTGSEIELEQITSDIRTCSFLSLDQNNSLRFGHKSFMEYFTSQHLVSLMSTKPKAEKALGKVLLSDEILYFLGDIVKSFNTDLVKNLYDLALRSSLSGTNALNILNYAEKPKSYLNKIESSKLTYVKLKINSLEYEQVKIQALKFTKCSVNKFLLNNSEIENLLVQGSAVKLTSTRSQKALLDLTSSTLQLNLKNSLIRNIQLTDSILEISNIQDSTVCFGVIFNSKIRNVVFNNTLLSSSDSKFFKKSKMEMVRFENCIFLNVNCNDFLQIADFKNCIFINCHLAKNASLERVQASHGYFINSQAPADRQAGGTKFDENLPIWNIEEINRILNQFLINKDKDNVLDKKQAMKRDTRELEQSRTATGDLEQSQTDKDKDNVLDKSRTKEKEKIYEKNFNQKEYLNKLTWNQALIVAFSLHLKNVKNIDLKQVRKILSYVDSKRDALILNYPKS